jgi:TetR/AcrR family transcriptional regulator, transcriptional repressor for nem operon
MLDQTVQPDRLRSVTSTTAPATVRGRETRERIVRAAAELVAERGVAGTSLDDVRTRAHASKSQLYHYFADRDDLLRAVARTTSDDVVGGQAELFERLDTIDGLRAWTDALVTLQQSRHAKGGCPIGSLAGQLAEQDEGARLALADGLHRWESAIREGLERMAARGELRRRPWRARSTHARSRTRRPAAHPDPTRSQPAPLHPGRRTERNPRRTRRTLNLRPRTVQG